MMIRRIKEDDIPSVVGMMLSNWDKIMSKYHSQENCKEVQGEVTRTGSSGRWHGKQVLVVEKDDKIIATGALADLGKPDAPRLSVSQFFVQPHLHGQGIGKRLMGHLIQIARDGAGSLLHVPSSRNAVPFLCGGRLCRGCDTAGRRRRDHLDDNGLEGNRRTSRCRRRFTARLSGSVMHRMKMINSKKQKYLIAAANIISAVSLGLCLLMLRSDPWILIIFYAQQQYLSI